MKLRDKINADLTAAMKAKEAARLSVLRMMKAAVKNREVELRAELDDSAALQVLSTLINQRRDSIEQFTRGGRPELADREAAEIQVIEEYMPAGVADAEIAAVVEEVVRATGASSPKDMGAVMKQCMARFAGKRVDGGKVSALVKQRLSAPPA
ncbi:MAG: glutamyl-tRNA amidotransferase [Acidobacteria bacterium]|nr:MAG: glutamyl-tRNA amidotransferase [Acidobacteriota bacterium]